MSTDVYTWYVRPGGFPGLDYAQNIQLFIVCVFSMLDRSFYLSTFSTTSIRADSSVLERSKFCAHKPTPQRYYVATYAVRTVGNALSCHQTGYDSYDIQILRNREEQSKSKEDKSKKENKKQ